MTHLLLVWRKVLNGRVAILSATSRRRADVSIKKISKKYKVLEDALLLRAEELEHSPDKDILTAALAQITNGLDVTAITGISDPLFDETVNEISKTLGAIVCKKCTVKSACSEDDRIVDCYGECIGFFRHCMELARKEAFAWYQRYLPGSLASPPEIEFSTELYVDPPDSISVAKHISGRTCFPDNHKMRSGIELCLHVSKFDLESYRAAAYILFHEMICHAFQGIRTAKSNKQRRTRETNSFAEGWMDRVTYLIFLCEVLLGYGLSGVKPALDEEVRQVARDFRKARLGDPEDPEFPRIRAFYWIGDQAAKEYSMFLNSHCTTVEAPEKLFFRISFDWNLEGDCPERRKFMQDVREHLIISPSRAGRKALKKSLDLYRKSNNIKDLAKYPKRTNRFI